MQKTRPMGGQGVTECFEQASTNATSFAWLIGAGFHFDVGKKLSILTNLDYLSTTPEFFRAKVKGSDGSIDYNTFRQEIKTINLSIGIGVRI